MHQLHQLLPRLVDAGIEFVVVGGYAGVLHGSSYVTNDLDVCAVLSAENVEKLRRALAELKPVHRMTHGKVSFLDYAPPERPPANLYLETEAGILDVIGSVLGLGDYEALARNAVSVPLFGRVCRVISLADLIKSKEALGREKDLLMAKELRAIAAKRGIRG
jgi:hypothetical protein